jgi:tetratricopeptide (TPR) repeat protein
MTVRLLWYFKQKIMKRNLCLILVLITFAGYGQTYNRDAKELFLNGIDKVSIRDYTGAILDFSGAIKLDSGFKQAYENRGVAKFYLEDYPGAIADYTKALEIDPNDYSTHGRRGWAEYNIQDYSGAIDDFTKALEGPKYNIRYHNIRGRTKYQLRDYEGAIADFDKVIKSWTSGKTQKNNAYYWRGLSKIELGQKESGCLDLKKASKAGYIKADRAIGSYCNK